MALGDDTLYPLSTLLLNQVTESVTVSPQQIKFVSISLNKSYAGMGEHG